MTSFLYARGIRIFDYPRFAEPLRDRIRERAQQVCEAAGIEIEHVNKSHIRKEDLVARVLARRGAAPGLIQVISAMEACTNYKPWLDKGNGHVYLRADTGKCLHYYFYFIDEEFGLCFLRVPTWAPFHLQFYCNVSGNPMAFLLAGPQVGMSARSGVLRLMAIVARDGPERPR